MPTPLQVKQQELEEARRKQVAEYGDRDRVEQGRILRRLIVGLKQEAKAYFDEYVMTAAKLKAGGYGLHQFSDGGHLTAAGDAYRDVVKRINEAIDQLAQLEGIRPYHVEAWTIDYNKLPQLPRGPHPPSYSVPGAKMKRSAPVRKGFRSASPSRRQMVSSLIRGRGTSYYQPRDPRTGKFVSQYY